MTISSNIIDSKSISEMFFSTSRIFCQYCKLEINNYDHSRMDLNKSLYSSHQKCQELIINYSGNKKSQMNPESLFKILKKFLTELIELNKNEKKLLKKF
ncbi:MAG: hypothetical protein HeimC3_55090 [Candidatus Heimdallarchaeota archaeon LC_3]|nr:MAG: hypothetical protein HeimC3_55090 [Candidatus Heimdallarchaeota archaeon LC_3]